MSVLKPGEEDLHYSDGSHRWVGPVNEARADARWTARVREHVEQHRREPGGSMPGRRLERQR